MEKPYDIFALRAFLNALVEEHIEQMQEEHQYLQDVDDTLEVSDPIAAIEEFTQYLDGRIEDLQERGIPITTG